MDGATTLAVGTVIGVSAGWPDPTGGAAVCAHAPPPTAKRAVTQLILPKGFIFNILV